jgi:hypothetical protein
MFSHPGLLLYNKPGCVCKRASFNLDLLAY